MANDTPLMTGADTPVATPAADTPPNPAPAEGDKPADAPAGEPAKAPEGDKPADQPAGDKPDGDKPKDEKPGAPESYEAFKMPDGVTLDDALGGEFNTLAKELNLSQADAQRVADIGGKIAHKLATAQQEAAANAVVEWRNQATVDKEFGGDKLAENLGVANKFIKEFASPELVTLLTESGLGNHPELIRLAWKAGKAMAEDKFITGSRTTPPADLDTRAANRLYGGTQQ